MITKRMIMVTLSGVCAVPTSILVLELIVMITGKGVTVSFPGWVALCVALTICFYGLFSWDLNQRRPDPPANQQSE